MPYSVMLLRPARPQDALAVAHVHVRSWQAAYRGIFSDEYLDHLHPEDRAPRYDFTHIDPRKPHTILAVEDGSILGFATTCPARDADLPDHGELCALYADPEWWGRGVGPALMAAARDRLRDLGFREAALWVLVENARARRFYERNGWTTAGLCRADTIWGETVNEIRYLRPL